MTPLGRPRTLSVRALALIFAVLVATLLGGWRAASMAGTTPGPSTLVVNGVSYTVDHVEQVKGLSATDLGGAAHGIQNLVTDDKTMVKVSLVVTAGDSPGSYDAGVLSIFATGSSVALPPAGGTLPPGRLSANASMEGSLSFVVPRNGSQLALRALGDSREVPLLQVDVAPPEAGAHPNPSASASATGDQPHPTTAATTAPTTHH